VKRISRYSARVASASRQPSIGRKDRWLLSIRDRLQLQSAARKDSRYVFFFWRSAGRRNGADLREGAPPHHPASEEPRKTVHRQGRKGRLGLAALSIGRSPRHASRS